MGLRRVEADHTRTPGPPSVTVVSLLPLAAPPVLRMRKTATSGALQAGWALSPRPRSIASPT